MSDLPEGFKDAIYVNSELHFGWKDRLRILFGRTVYFDTRTLTENLPGNTETDRTRIIIGPIFPRRRRMQCGVVEMEIPKK